MVFGNWARVVVPAPLPLLKVEFPVSNTAAGGAISVLWFTYDIMQFPLGFFSDSFGERNVLVASAAIITLSIVGVGTSSLFVTFVAAFGLLGIGTGLYATLRVTVLAHAYPKQEGRALGITFAADGDRFFPDAPAVAYSALRCVAGDSASEHEPEYRRDLVGPRSAVDDRGKCRSLPVLLATLGFTLVLFSYQGFISFFVTYMVKIWETDQGVANALYALHFAVGPLVQQIAGKLSDSYSDRYILYELAAVSAITLVAFLLVACAEFWARPGR